LEDAFSILTPLLAVIIVIFGAYWTAKWMGRHHNAYSSGRQIQVLERVMLARDTYLALIKVGGRTHLMSVGAGRVELLRELEQQELAGVEAKRPGNDFFGTLIKSMGKGKQPPAQSGSGEGQDGTQP
jgi:flagellar biosynthetic protein FliO